MTFARTFTAAALLLASAGLGTAAVAQDGPNRDRGQDRQTTRDQGGDQRQGQGQYDQRRDAGNGDGRYGGDRADQRGGDGRGYGDQRDQGRGYDDHGRGDRRGDQRYRGNNGHRYGQHRPRCVTQWQHHHRVTRCY